MNHPVEPNAESSLESSSGARSLDRQNVNEWSVVHMLASREWIRFFRQRQRVISAVGQPIFFWLLFGSGMHSMFRGGDQDFLTYYLPGTLVLILLFTAIFTTISIIEDRNQGFLQGVLVAPVPRWTIAGGKVLGGAAIAWVQAMLFFGLAMVIGMIEPSLKLPLIFLMMALAALGLTALGVCFAWPMDSTQGFHAVMSLVLMPLWLLSGAFFPVPLLGTESNVGQWVMHWIMRCNPLSYTVAGIRNMMIEQPLQGVWLPAQATCWLVTIGFVAVSFLASVYIVQKNSKG